MIIRPSNDRLVDILFDDMKKIHSVVEKLQREVSDLQNMTENIPKDMKMIDSSLNDITRQLDELKNRFRDESGDKVK